MHRLLNRDHLARAHRFFEQYGGKADASNHVTQYGYLQSQVLVEVLQKCGADCDSAKFLSTITKMGSIDTEGFTFGPIKYDAGSTAGLDTGSFYTWDSAKKQVTLIPGTYTYPN